MNIIGIAAGIEPSLYTFLRTPYSLTDFPYRARILTVDLSLIPTVAARLSKRMALDIKAISNFLIADYGGLREENPILTVNQQKAERDYDPPQVTLAFSVLLRYQIQEAKRKRR